jgi:hypothetical protein
MRGLLSPDPTILGTPKVSARPQARRRTIWPLDQILINASNLDENALLCASAKLIVFIRFSDVWPYRSAEDPMLRRI